MLSHAAQTVLLALHFLCVDVAMIGPLGALFLVRRARRRGDQDADAAARWLVGLSWKALVAAILLGLTIGLLLWGGDGERFFAGLRLMPRSRLYFSVAELVFYFALVVPCALAWEPLKRWPLLRAILLLAASTNLIYHFPALFISAAELGAAPARQTEISSAEFRGLMLAPAVLAQVFHHVLSAVAVVGVALMAYASRRGPVATDEPPPLFAGSARTALMATLLQIPVGLWLISTLAPGARGAVLGADVLTTGLFIAAMTAALGLLHFLSSAAMGDAGRGQVRGAVALLVLVILLMTGTLREIRQRRAGAVLPQVNTTTLWRQP